MFRALRFARAPSAATFARSSLFSLALATLVACLTECGAGAAPAPVTLFSTAVCTAPGDQSDPQVVSDGGGGAVVVWVDRRGADADVYASHLLVSGVRDPAWPVDGLALVAARASCSTATTDSSWRGRTRAAASATSTRSASRSRA